jgi:hypothetical protein
MSMMQLSILEIFFVTTFAATALAVYLYWSQVLAFVAGGSLIVVAAVRALSIENAVVSGILAFIISMAVVAVILMMVGGHRSDSAALLILPPLAYLYGYGATALRDDSL